jgi:hypothetical protein
VIVPCTAIFISAWISGRAGVHQLFASLLRWLIGLTRWLRDYSP